MDVGVLIASVVVAAAFALSGWSKLGEQAETAATARAFGLPAKVAGLVGAWLPALELVIAASLLFPLVAWFGGLAAMAVLCVFTLAMVARLSKGERPSCNCFGQTKSTPISWFTVARNGALLVASAYAVSAGPESSGIVLGVFDAARGQAGAALGIGLVFLLVVCFAWVVAQLLRQQGRLLLRIDNLEFKLDALGAPQFASLPVGATFPVPVNLLHIGDKAPPFAGTTLGGLPRTLADLVTESAGPMLLVFAGAECAPCRDLIKDLLSWRRSDSLPVAWSTVASGGAIAVRETMPGLAAERVMLQNGSEINDLYGVIATPSALWIEADGSIGSSVAVGRDAILSLFHRHETGNATFTEFASLKPA